MYDHQVDDDHSKSRGGAKPPKPKLFAIDGGEPRDVADERDGDVVIELDPHIEEAEEEEESSSYVSPKDRVAAAERELALALVHLASETLWRDERAALMNVERALELDPLCGAAHHQHGYLLRLWHEEAIASHTQALALEPTNVGYYRGRADQYMSHGDLALALADYNRAVGVDPKDVLSRAGRARLLLEMGRLEEAFLEFGRALRCTRHHRGGLHRERLAVLRLIGDEARLLGEIDAVLLEEPNHPAAWSERAFHHARRGDWANARRYLTEEIERTSATYSTYSRYARAICALWEGDARAALPDASAALKSDPKQAYFLICRAEAHALLGDHASALADLTFAAKENSHDQNAHVVCARFILSTKVAPPATALLHARAAVRLEPTEASHHADLAWALLACGDARAARREIAAGLRMRSNAKRRKKKPHTRAEDGFRIRHYTTAEYAGFGLDLRLPRPRTLAEIRALRARIDQAAPKR